MSSLYDWDDEELGNRPEENRCTPEKLLAFIEEIGRMPTLKECKDRWGGILGAIVDAWELQRQGRFPAYPRRGRSH